MHTARQVLLLCLLCTTATLGIAQITETVNTSASGTVNYSGASVSAGPWPFSNFGIKASASYGFGPANVGVGGNTQFLFPQYTPGTIINPLDIMNIGYTPNWTGSVSSAASFDASASFHYNIGPFGGDFNLFNRSLNTSPSANLVSGGQLFSGATQSNASTPIGTFGVTFNALFASATASASLNLFMKQNVSWNPSTQYGYYWWTNQSGTLSAADTLHWQSVTSGPLGFTFPFNPGFIHQPFDLNILPGIRLDMPFGQSSFLGLGVNGHLGVDLFGSTVVNYNFPPVQAAFPFSLLAGNYDFNPDWYAGDFYSLPLEFNDLNYTVQGSPQLVFQSFVGNTGPDPGNNQLTGSWLQVPGVTDQPDPQVPCVPGGPPICALNDPSINLGSVPVVTFTESQVPEPSTMVLLASGAAFLIRRRRQK
jgi:hypothetical protein